MSDRQTYMRDGEEFEMIDVPKPEILRAAVKHIENHIEQWNQRDWVNRPPVAPETGNACHTTACLAGHILLSQGRKWDDLDENSMPSDALDLLGFDRDVDSQRHDFDNEIFCYTHDHSEGGDENVLAYTPEKLDAFKAWVTKVTGVTFDE